MNWFFPTSKGSGSLPPLNSLQQQRQRQIESLKAAHPSLAEIQKDVEYRIPFTVNNSTISVNILLPPQFPQEKPVVSVFPPVGHHLVDSNNGTMIKSPLITNFGMHSDLGKVIQSLLDEFWKSPPALMSSGFWLIFYLYPLKCTYNKSYKLFMFFVSGHTHQIITLTYLPIYPLFSLSTPSLTQLSDMSENEDVLLKFFVSLPQLKQVTSDKEELVNSILDMAKKNLQMEPHLEGKRQEMLYKYEQLTQMKSAFETKMQRQHELSESCSLSTLQARLKVAAHQAEEESEETAENFLEGRIDIDEFLNSFMEKRTLCHSRRAKEEKLQQSINTHGPFPTSH
uniref:VPS37 C-terminal domain-containing protein n=1 Tax=Astatotilapia calliptera TaxID=8154 RepID=A0AAX7STX1_ASTCA